MLRVITSTMNDSLKYDENISLSIDDEIVETHYLHDISTGRIKFIKDDPCYIFVKKIFLEYGYNINNYHTINEYNNIWSVISNKSFDITVLR